MNTKNGMASALALVLSWSSSCLAEDVNFSDLFASGALGNDIVVQVGIDQTLLLTEGLYVVSEKNLFITASHARVSGAVVIASFSEDDAAVAKPGTPDNWPYRQSWGPDGKGYPGKTGETGNPGASAGSLILDLGDLTFEQSSSLRLVARGQKGGPGQTGGMGGTGSPGGSGGDAGDDLACSKPCPERGLPGFQGGQRGAGGTGGSGGDGASVYLSSNLFNLKDMPASGFVVDLTGGQGGAPGAPGERGLGGDGGPRGKGSDSCRCRNVPGPGPQGPPGPDLADPTPPAATGAPGTVQKL